MSFVLLEFQGGEISSRGAATPLQPPLNEALLDLSSGTFANPKSLGPEGVQNSELVKCMYYGFNEALCYVVSN